LALARSAGGSGASIRPQRLDQRDAGEPLLVRYNKHWRSSLQAAADGQCRLQRKKKQRRKDAVQISKGASLSAAVGFDAWTAGVKNCVVFY
jgi:hypothetical protein